MLYLYIYIVVLHPIIRSRSSWGSVSKYEPSINVWWDTRMQNRDPWPLSHGLLNHSVDVWCLGIPPRLVWWQPYFFLLILVVYHVSSARMFPAGGESLFPIPKYSRIVSAWDPPISGSLFPGNSHATEIWNLASVGSLWKNGENGGFGYGGPILGDGSTAMSLNAIDDFIWKRATPESHGLSVHQHFPYWNCHLGTSSLTLFDESTALPVRPNIPSVQICLFPLHGDSMHTHTHWLNTPWMELGSGRISLHVGIPLHSSGQHVRWKT